MQVSNSSQIISELRRDSRRAFIGNCAALASVPVLAGLPVNAFAAGASDVLKVGVIGTGGRGRDAVRNILAAHPSVKIWALGDLFEDRVTKVRNDLNKNPRSAVPQERAFVGFDAYKDVINSGVDLVILTTPPHFRPLHMEAAVEKGVHIFAEKPVAVDPAGCRRVIALGELAAQKKLSIVAGTQRRHHAGYVETLKRIKEGAIGELVGGQCYWVGGELWHNARQPGWTDMEYQIRNWLYYTWLSGDHIVEQHVHNIDIINWAFGGPPVKAFGVGGRQRRTLPRYGDAWDHFAIEFEYANGARVSSVCRQSNNTANRVNERLVGTLGTAIPNGKIQLFKGETWNYKGKVPPEYVQEHVDLIESIRNGTPLNEARTVAESTLTGILGRVSAYTGKEVSYKWILEASKLDLTPPAYKFGEAPEVKVAIPGTTRLV
ncbi:MAG: Gfo/Idh/MocA family oxidoreductase [Puniceicoccales bacterium]|jgi:predicted dehydrogenase|nr:Gfo/Idh/MocA family oxidoreductase [Puniceicoccales bacterium]